MTTRERLEEYAVLLNKCGVDSEEARLYLEQHEFDKEFSELARLSNKLKRALTATSDIRLCHGSQRPI